MRLYLLFALITCAFGVAQLQAENARLKQSNEALRGALKAIEEEDSVGILLEEEVLLGVGYDHVKQGCVNGANLIKYEDKTVDECADLCDKRDDCVAFEYGVNYGGSGRYKAKDCQLQSSDDYKGCSGIHHNLDLYIKPDIDYEHIDAGCVNGANIHLYHDTSISDCAEMCDNHDDCVAFEYGVARGGAGKYNSRDCQLQSSSNYNDCSGKYHNLDLYIKPIDVGYEKIDAGCVDGHNIILYHHKTIPECAALCNARDDCVAFEYGVDYEGAGKYKGQDCQLQSSANYERCDGTHHNLDLYIKPEINYEHVDRGCVNGENLVLYKDQSVFECAKLCDQRSDCVAFEYGVNHGGDGRYESRDCQLQSSDNYESCSGEYHNLDLYIKSDEAMVGGGANNCGGYLDFDELPSNWCSKMSRWAICGIGNGVIDGSGYGCKFFPAERRTGYCKTRDSGNQCNQFQAAENCPEYLDYEDLPSNWCSQLSRWAICGIGNGVVDGSGYGCKFHPAERRKGYCKDPNYTNQCAKFVKSDNCNGYMTYAQLPSNWCSRLSPWAICGIGNGVIDGRGYGCEFFPDRSGYCKSPSSNDQCTAFLLSGAEEMLGATTVTGEDYCESDEMISNESGCKSSSCCHWNTWEEGEASFHGQGRCWSDIGNDICQDTSSPNDGYIVYNGDCPGSDIRNHPVETLDECKALCDAEPECLGFGRNDLTKSCWLKTIRSCGGEVVPTCPGNHCFYAKSTQGIEETCSTCRVRRSWNGLSEDEKRTYIDTVNTARREEPYKSQYDALVMSHGKLDSGTIHGREQFLAWHRWFIYEYENLLRQITPCITVPYWAWEVAGSDWHLDEMWGPENYQFGTCMPDQPGSNWWDPAPSVNDGPFSDMILPGTDLPLSRACVLPDRGGRIPKLSDLDFLETSSDDFWSFFDGIDGVHRTVHGMIGGTMGSIGTAGMAPEFFLHHNNVDRIWAQWQLKSASHELAQSSRDAILLGTDQTYTVDDFTRPRSQAEICVEYDDHLADTSGRRRLSARTTKVNLAVAISNRLPKDVTFRNLLVHTNQLSIQVSEDFEAKQLMFAAKQKGDSLSEQRAHQIAHQHQENSSWGKYLKERKVDTEYKPDSEAKAFFADIVGITAESVRHALEVTHKFKRLQAFDRQWKELEQLFSEN